MTVLTTDRLTLRQARESDAAFLHRLMTEEAFLRYIGDRGVRTVDDAKAYIRTSYLASYAEHGFGLYVVERKHGGPSVGICGLLRRQGMTDVEIGFAFLPEHRGLGYATESAAAVMDHARERLGLRRIAAITDPDNAVSIRVLERLGMTFEGMIRLSPEAVELRLYAASRG